MAAITQNCVRVSIVARLKIEIRVMIRLRAAIRVIAHKSIIRVLRYLRKYQRSPRKGVLRNIGNLLIDVFQLVVNHLSS